MKCMSEVVYSDKNEGVYSNMEVIYSDQLVYRCMDGGFFLLDPRCRYESGHVDWEIKDMEIEQAQDPDPSEIAAWGSWMLDGSLGQFPCYLNISRRVLNLVKMFCLARFDIFREYYVAAKDDDVNIPLLLDKVQEFDSLFVQEKSFTLLVQLMDAAIELRIKSLFDLTRNAIDEKIDRMSAKQILKIFNLPDLTHKVWKEPILDDWAHKQLNF